MSTQTNCTNGLNVTASAAVTARKLIKWDGSLCGLNATRDWIGQSQEPRASGEQIPVRTPYVGTAIGTASEAIVKGDPVYKAANGFLSKTATSSIQVGIALEAASGVNIEFQYLPI